MKRKILKVVIAVIGVLLLLFSAFLLSRLFESEEDKALRGMNDIIREYVPAKIGDIVDFVHSFDHGSYTYENGKLIITNAEKVDMELSDALSSIKKMNIVLEKYMLQNKILSDEDTEIIIRFECQANWSMTLMPKTKSIGIGVTRLTPFGKEMLSLCKEYKSIHIGGYWGYNVTIPDDINSSFFEDFTNLESLDIDSIETEAMKDFLDNALKGLPETCTDINTEVRRSY